VGRGFGLASIIRMSDTGHFITHVSDTARWTALHRATESARADALFSDPLAERLAGEHGRAIVARVPRSTRNGWWLIARTKIIDDVIARSIADGCDQVWNLAALGHPAISFGPSVRFPLDSLAAADGSTAPGRQPLECGCTPYPLSSANG
jgi:Leucine carboxyl methyltransferase